MPYHCLGSIWSQRDKKGKEHLAPTIRATVAQFNNVANCVITTCLGDQSMKAPDRARVVEHWIEVARVGYRRCLGASFFFLHRPQGHTARRTFTPGTVHLSCCVSENPWHALWELPGVKEGLIHGMSPPCPQECRVLKNFSSLYAILSALQSNAIHRLKKTWEEVSR